MQTIIGQYLIRKTILSHVSSLGSSLSLRLCFQQSPSCEISASTCVYVYSLHAVSLALMNSLYIGGLVYCATGFSRFWNRPQGEGSFRCKKLSGGHSTIYYPIQSTVNRRELSAHSVNIVVYRVNHPIKFIFVLKFVFMGSRVTYINL